MINKRHHHRKRFLHNLHPDGRCPDLRIISIMGNIPKQLVNGNINLGMEGMRYQCGSMQLEPGDKIFQYTDGVTEATNQEMELYGMERLAAPLPDTPVPQAVHPQTPSPGQYSLPQRLRLIPSFLHLHSFFIFQTQHSNIVKLQSLSHKSVCLSRRLRECWIWRRASLGLSTQGMRSLISVREMDMSRIPPGPETPERCREAWTPEYSLQYPTPSRFSPSPP